MSYSYFKFADLSRAYRSYSGAWKENDIPLTKKEGEVLERAEAITDLHERIKAGQTVYTKLNHCSSSGMTRYISLFIIVDNELSNIDYLVGLALGERSVSGKHEGLKATGCGMDMGFHLVYNLGRTMWPTGTNKPHGTRNGEPDSDGGYALKHRWI